MIDRDCACVSEMCFVSVSIIIVGLCVSTVSLMTSIFFLFLLLYDLLFLPWVGSVIVCTFITKMRIYATYKGVLEGWFIWSA